MLWQTLLMSSILLALAREFRLRRRAERALSEAKTQIHLRERKIQTILDNAPIVFSAIDANGIFHMSEGKGLEKLGRKNNQSVGVSIYEMHNQNPIILDAVKKALNGEQVATSFVLHGIFYDLFMGPEKNSEGVVTGISMLSVDISDRKKIEAEKAQILAREQAAIETSKLKSEFLATMSHEIRTPLNGVLGMTSLLLDTSLDAQQKEYAEAIRQSGSGLLTVINDILDFSKIEAGKMDFEEIHFDLPALVNHITKGLSFAAKQKQIQLATEIAPELPHWVMGDPGRFKQILNNIIGNAIKFTEKGSVRVRVRSEKLNSDRARHLIRVEVEDTGIGISPEALSRLFSPFSQADTSMSRRFGGTGLGLSIAKQLAEKMSGQVGVTSEKGRGSSFWVSIPFYLGQSPLQSVNVLSEIKSLKSDNPIEIKILLAEDNRVNQMIAVRMLEKMGIHTVVAVDGLEALSALEKSNYDLVLMDCQMPNMDGLEATRKIRSHPSLINRDIPILAMTANAMKGDREKCLAAGMDDYLTKPVSFGTLSATVSHWLQISQQRKQAKAS